MTQELFCFMPETFTRTSWRFQYQMTHCLVVLLQCGADEWCAFSVHWMGFDAPSGMVEVDTASAALGLLLDYERSVLPSSHGDLFSEFLDEVAAGTSFRVSRSFEHAVDERERMRMDCRAGRAHRIEPPPT